MNEPLATQWFLIAAQSMFDFVIFGDETDQKHVLCDLPNSPVVLKSPTSDEASPDSGMELQNDSDAFGALVGRRAQRLRGSTASLKGQSDIAFFDWQTYLSCVDYERVPFAKWICVGQ